MKKHLIGGYLAMAAALIVASNARGNSIVFVNQPGNGSQQGFVLGMDFVVNTPVTVTELGAFDSGGDGFANTIHVGIYNVNTAALLGSADLIGTVGTLIAGSRFVSVTPFTLNPGRIPRATPRPGYRGCHLRSSMVARAHGRADRCASRCCRHP